MSYFLNDYGVLCHPDILKAMEKANMISELGYYEDSHSNYARELIKKQLGEKSAAGIYFMTGGTNANITAISAFLRPYQAVIAPCHSHIHLHETGAIEAIGHKILTVDSKDGKITPGHIEDVLDKFSGIHMVKPKMVFITNATEIGTVYKKKELIKLKECCKKNDLILYCDGARLGAGLMSRYSDLSMADMAEYTDAFYIGGTKNGALLGEAMIIMNPDLTENFRYMKKQKGSLLAKGALVGIQFEELFKKDGKLFYGLAELENRLADKLVDGLKMKEYQFWSEPQSNQIFPIMTIEKLEELEKDFQLMRWEKIDEKHYAVRLVISWATDKKAIEQLIEVL